MKTVKAHVTEISPSQYGPTLQSKKDAERNARRNGWTTLVEIEFSDGLKVYAALHCLPEEISKY